MITTAFPVKGWQTVAVIDSLRSEYRTTRMLSVSVQRLFVSGATSSTPRVPPAKTAVASGRHRPRGGSNLALFSYHQKNSRGSGATAKSAKVSPTVPPTAGGPRV